jgi:hypothetical protein
LLSERDGPITVSEGYEGRGAVGGIESGRGKKAKKRNTATERDHRKHRGPEPFRIPALGLQ